jgi:hypothetical protein
MININYISRQNIVNIQQVGRVHWIKTHFTHASHTMSARQRKRFLHVDYKEYVAEGILNSVTSQISSASSENFYLSLEKNTATLGASVHSLAHSWSWALLEMPLVVQLLKNLPAFYGTRRFITVFPRALHWFLYWARSIQSIPSHPSSLWPILILSTYLPLGLPSGLFLCGFRTNILYAFIFSPIRAACPTRRILLDLINLIIFGEGYKLWSSSLLPPTLSLNNRESLRNSIYRFFLAYRCLALLIFIFRKSIIRPYFTGKKQNKIWNSI